MKKNWMKKRGVLAIFSIIALIGGILFLDPSITGNLIFEKKIQFNLISLIGIALVICSIIIALYSIKNK